MYKYNNVSEVLADESIDRGIFEVLSQYSQEELIKVIQYSSMLLDIDRVEVPVEAKVEEGTKLEKPLYSREYQFILEQTHKEKSWGFTARDHVEKIKNLNNENKAMLDYGCGSGDRLENYFENITNYDIAVPELVNNNIPKPFVVCCDVLEHVEPEYLNNVLEDLERVTLDKAYFTISHRPAKKILPNGWNAHLIIKDVDWWKQRLKKYFNVIDFGIWEYKGSWFYLESKNAR